MASNVTKIFKTVAVFARKHAPEILTGIGIAGMVTSTVLAVKETPKALELIEAKKEELDAEKLTPAEVVKTTWKCYAPAVVTGVSAIGCLIGGTHVSLRRNAALATAYNLSRTALSEYKEKMIEVVGEEKAQEVKEKVAQAVLDKNPVSNSPVVDMLAGEQLFYDYMSGRYFLSEEWKIIRAASDIYEEISTSGDGVCLNDFYNNLGLPHIGTGDILGWNPAHKPELDMTRAIRAEDGRSAIVVSFREEPVYDYDNWYA